MSQNIFLFLFLAASPFVFMPSIIALFTRNPRKVWVVVGNIVVWAVGFISVRNLSADGDGFGLPVPVALLGWIGLLALAIRRPATAAQSERNDAGA